MKQGEAELKVHDNDPSGSETCTKTQSMFTDIFVITFSEWSYKNIMVLSSFLQPDPLPSPPVGSHTGDAETNKSYSEEESPHPQDKGCDRTLEDQTSDQTKSSSNSRNDERKHGYKMAFVKSP